MYTYNIYLQWEKVQKGKVLVLTSPSLSKKRAAEGITIGQDIFEIQADDLVVICELGRRKQRRQILKLSL